MSIISQSNTAATTAAATPQATTNGQTAAAEETAAAKDSAATQTTSTEKESVQLSTRAQKLQKLEKEFFPGGPQSIQITPDFVERLHEYGFLSDTDLKRLPEGLRNGSDSKPTALSSVLDDSQSLLARLEDKPEHKSLFDAITAARSELEKSEGSNGDFNAARAKSAVTALSEELTKAPEDALTKEETKTVKDLLVALNVVSSFTGSPDKAAARLGFFS